MYYIDTLGKSVFLIFFFVCLVIYLIDNKKNKKKHNGWNYLGILIYF